MFYFLFIAAFSIAAIDMSIAALLYCGAAVKTAIAAGAPIEECRNRRESATIDEFFYFLLRRSSIATPSIDERVPKLEGFYTVLFSV